MSHKSRGIRRLGGSNNSGYTVCVTLASGRNLISSGKIGATCRIGGGGRNDPAHCAISLSRTGGSIVTCNSVASRRSGNSFSRDKGMI